MSRCRSIVAACAAAAMVVSGACSSDSGAADGDVENALDRSVDERDATPLDDELGGDEIMSAESGDSLAACMAAAGFDDFAPGPEDAASSTDSSDDALSVREYAEQWGYGISTVLDEDGTRRDDAPSVARPAAEGPAGWADYRASLPEERRVAFDVALYGDGSETGCIAGALTTRGGSPEDQKELDGLLRDMYARIDADPAIEEANDRYATCMDDAGYPDIAAPVDALSEVGRRTDAVFGDSAVDPALDVDPDLGGQAPVEGDDAAGGGPIESAPVTVGQLEPGALEAVQDFERELATVEIGCRVRLELEIAEVSDRYEAEFVEANRELLDRVE